MSGVGMSGVVSIQLTFRDARRETRDARRETRDAGEDKSETHRAVPIGLRGECFAALGDDNLARPGGVARGFSRLRKEGAPLRTAGDAGGVGVRAKSGSVCACCHLYVRELHPTLRLWQIRAHNTTRERQSAQTDPDSPVDGSPKGAGAARPNQSERGSGRRGTSHGMQGGTPARGQLHRRWVRWFGALSAGRCGEGSFRIPARTSIQ